MRRAQAMAPGIRVLIASDKPVVRRGLFTAICAQPDMAIAGEAANLEDVLQCSQREEPDVIVLDLRLPGTLPDAAVTQVRRACPFVRILLLSAEDASQDLFRTMDAGASGCVLQSAALTEVVAAIRTIHTGEVWLSAQLSEHWSAYHTGGKLNADELEYLRLLAAGNTHEQIAAVMEFRVDWVRMLVRRIQRKLGSKNETEMLVTALRLRIVSMD